MDFFAKVQEIMAAFEQHIADAGYGPQIPPDTVLGGRMLAWPGQWIQPTAGDRELCYWFEVIAFRIVEGPPFKRAQDGRWDVYRYGDADAPEPRPQGE